VFEKPAPVDYPILDLLQRRWSTRAFADQPLERSIIPTLFEAARWAPSSGNGQPWTFIFVTRDDTAAFEKLASVLVPGNAWAKNAALLAVSVASLEREPGKPNKHAWHDVGLASENLVLQAFSMGLAVHMMAGFDAQRTRELYEIPERCDPVAMIAVGYPGDPNALAEELRKKDLSTRQRKPIREFVFANKWGQPASFD
jgi:nitroreductase